MNLSLASDAELKSVADIGDEIEATVTDTMDHLVARKSYTVTQEAVDAGRATVDLILSLKPLVFVHLIDFIGKIDANFRYRMELGKSYQTQCT